MFKIYDKWTLLLIALQYMNEGGSSMLTLCCTLVYGRFFSVDEYMTINCYICLIMSPEAFSMLWGILSDQIPLTIRGSPRRGHILLASLL